MHQVNVEIVEASIACHFDSIASLLAIVNPAEAGELVVVKALDADGEAIIALGRRSVEALPDGEWPGLYDAFTQEFRDRCSFSDFVAAGETDTADLGSSLQEISFKYLIDVVMSSDTASAVIVGALSDDEYSIETAYLRADGVWKIAPAPATTGCSAFNRLSG